MAGFIHIMRQILTDIILGEHIEEKKNAHNSNRHCPKMPNR